MQIGAVVLRCRRGHILAMVKALTRGFGDVQYSPPIPEVCPEPYWGAYSAPSDHLAGGEEELLPPLEEPHPDLGPSGLATSPTPFFSGTPVSFF